MTEMLVAAVLLAFVILWMKVCRLEWEAQQDHRYFEWWMASMENRKVDKERRDEAHEGEDF